MISISDYVTLNGGRGQAVHLQWMKKMGGKSDERRMIKGKRREGEDYLISVQRERAWDLIMDK